ncbi:MAG: AAA family ATPase [Clostridia bacterium]|nr:AAA family ATPase [Clostridia bacterium]
MEENEKIEFSFEWTGNGFNEIAPNVKDMANKLVELNMIRVDKDLDENGNIVVLHAGVCKRQGLVESLARGMANENIYNYKFIIRLHESLNTICRGRAESKFNYCEMPSCPIMVAGYIWYLKNRKETENQEVQEIGTNVTDNDIYNRNYDELKKMQFDTEVEKMLMPLATPSIKGLRCAFVGDEGTNKENTIEKVADYLYRIGKISSNKVLNINLGANFELQNDRLYSIIELDNYLEAIANNDDFSNSAEAGRKINKGNIKKIVSQTKGKYIIVNCTSLEFKRFLETNSKLPYVFDNEIHFNDFKNEEILKMFEQNLPEYHKNIMDYDKRKEFLEYLERNRKHIPFKNGDLSSFLAGYVSRKDELELPKERYEVTTIEDMFENLIGMNNVKKQLKELNEFLKLQKRLEKLGKTVPSFNLHMMFLGNAGTGKTTVARMIAKTLFDLGYTKENKCVEVAAKDLIAAFTGQTPLKTGRVINSAIRRSIIY